MIKIILAEDHIIVRNGLKLFFETQFGIEIVAEASHGQEVLEYLDHHGNADIVLADINMPVMNGIELTRTLQQRGSKVKVIILSMMDSEECVLQAFSAGACAYLLKNIDNEEMNFALKKVMSGNRYLCIEMVNKLLIELINNKSPLVNEDHETVADLSNRENEILQLISDGYTNAEMAEKLFLSKRTVEGHRQALIEKIGARNTASLIRYAVRNRIVK